MTREEVKNMLPVYEAYANGEKTQFYNDMRQEWQDMGEDFDFNPDVCTQFRINPESNFRSFKNTEELIHVYETMMNKLLGVDQSFIDTCMCLPSIWIKHKTDGRKILIVEFGENFVKVGAKSKPITLEVLFSNYTFCDESPCGVEVE